MTTHHLPASDPTRCERLNRAATGICLAHGTALVSLAKLLVDDSDEALALAACCLAEECLVPTEAAENSDRTLRRHLVRRMYLSWQDSCNESERSHTEDLPGVALGLCTSGQQTYREAAILLQLPAPAVAELLREGLRGAAGQPG